MPDTKSVRATRDTQNVHQEGLATGVNCVFLSELASPTKGATVKRALIKSIASQPAYGHKGLIKISHRWTG